MPQTPSPRGFFVSQSASNEFCHKKLRLKNISKQWPLPTFKISRCATASSAAVERLFGIKKDILKPKCCGLSENHLEMLAFRTGN